MVVLLHNSWAWGETLRTGEETTAEWGRESPFYLLPTSSFWGMKKSLKLSVLTHLFKLNMHILPADRGREVLCVIKILKNFLKGGIVYLEGKFVAWLLDHLCSDQHNSSLSWNQPHSSNTLTPNETNLFQMGRFWKNFTPQTSMRCNQSNLSSSGTAEDTEKHLVRWISFPDLVGIGAAVLDLQWDLDTKPKLGLCRRILLLWIEAVLFRHNRVQSHQ